MDPRLLALERRLYRSAVDLGVWDVLLGAALLALGAGLAFGHPRMGAFVLPVAIASGPALMLLAARRAGFVQFRRERARKVRLAAFALAGITAALLALLLLAERALPDMAKAATLLAVPVAVGGYVFDIRRLWAYAAIIVVAVSAVTLADLPGEVALMTAGTAILCWGSVILIGRLGPARNSVTRS